MRLSAAQARKRLLVIAPHVSGRYFMHRRLLGKGGALRLSPSLQKSPHHAVTAPGPDGRRIAADSEVGPQPVCNTKPQDTVVTASVIQLLFFYTVMIILTTAPSKTRAPPRWGT